MNHQRTEILERLDAGVEALRSVVAACPDALASIRTGPDRWSILDCLEHLVLAEEYLCRQVEAGTPVAPLRNEAREVRIITAGMDRTRRISAPNASRPTGRWLSIVEAMNALLVARSRTVAFVERFDGDLRAWHVTHPIVGPVNGYEMLLMIAVHPMRHAQQIAEIRATIPVT